MDTTVFSPIKYISQTLEDDNFIAEWKGLSDKDKSELKQYAIDEAEANGKEAKNNVR